MEQWQNKIAVVTGANSGIGHAIAKDLVKAGVKVVGLDKRTEAIDEYIQQLPSDQRSLLTALMCDITNVESVNRVFDYIISEFGGVDILVNCAGCARAGLLVSMDPQDAADVMQTNVMGMVYCAQRAFKSMKERNGTKGHVILMNSMFGHKIISWPAEEESSVNMYAPSKYAVTAMTEIYRQEFWNLGTKVKVTSISPGLVDTSLPSEAVREARKDCILSPHDVSNAVLFALSTPPHVQIHELTIRPLGDFA